MKNTQLGFTLLELLIVTAILGILAVIFTSKITQIRTEAQKTAGQAWARQVLTAAQFQLAEDREILGFTAQQANKSVSCAVGISVPLPPMLHSPILDANHNCKVNSDGAVAVTFTIGGRNYSWSSVINRVIDTDSAYIDSDHF